MQEQYLKRLADTHKKYRLLVICCAIIALAAIAVAILYQLLLGIAIALFCAGIFIYVSSELIYDKLGISYTHECGTIHIKRAVSKYGDTLFIPSRLLWADVTCIGDEAFSSVKNEELCRVYLPKSITSVGKNVFGAHAARIEIYYEGSAQDFCLIDGVEGLVFGEISFGCAQPILPKKSKDTIKSDSSDSTGESEK